MEYKGSCHCGQVKFIVKGELLEALSCNCSICQKKGSSLWSLPSSQVTVSFESSDLLENYTFNKHVITIISVKFVVFILMLKVQMQRVMLSLLLMFDA